jgi:hypothetical protein
MSCIVYIVSCNFTTHSTCLLTLMAYKYSELQVSFVIKKLHCKANYKTPFFLIMISNCKKKLQMDLFVYNVIIVILIHIFKRI